MHRPATPCLALFALLCSGCNLLQLTPTSQVIRTRIAAVRAEPAEIGLGETTTLEALLVHEPGPRPDLGALWFACVQAGGATGCLGLDLGEFFGGAPPEGDDDDSATSEPDLADFQFGIGDRFDFTAEGPILEAAFAALSPEERVEGITVLISVNYVQKSNAELGALLLELAVAAQSGDQASTDALTTELQDLFEGAISGARRIIVSDKAPALPASIPCPVSELLPNSNPRISDLLLHSDEDGKDAGQRLGEVTFVGAGESLYLRPQLVEGAGAEDYLYITQDGATECRKETPFFAWLVNGGTVDSNYSFTADAEDYDEIEGRPKLNVLHLPPADEFPSALDLWLVVRDRRGGENWEHYSLLRDAPR